MKPRAVGGFSLMPSPGRVCRASFPHCPAAHAGRTRRSPSSCGYRGPASPMKCARSIVGECLASSKARGRQSFADLLYAP